MKKVIEVIIKGDEGDRNVVLKALLADVSYTRIQEILLSLPEERMIKLSQCMHGALYKRMRGDG